MASITAGNAGSEYLNASKRLTVTLETGSIALIQRYTGSTLVDAARITATTTYGPYFDDMRFQVSCLQGTVTTAIAAVTDAATMAGADASFGNDVWDITGDGAPVDGARATLSRNPAGDDNALTFTAVAYGSIGNLITIGYTDPAAASQSLAVSVSGYAISVSLATNGGSTITSTAAQVKAAIEATPLAAALVTCAVNAADSGVADDGSGVVTALAAAAMTGGAGTGIGKVGPGGRYTDYTNANLYINAGTKAAPVWKLVTRAA